MSPVEIKILLHIYACVEPYTEPESPHCIMTVKKTLQDYGLIDRADYPKCTAAGKKMVDMLMDTPIPVNVWVDPRFDLQVKQS